MTLMRLNILIAWRHHKMYVSYYKQCWEIRNSVINYLHPTQPIAKLALLLRVHYCRMFVVVMFCLLTTCTDCIAINYSST